jgi:beta-galactosidase
VIRCGELTCRLDRQAGRLVDLSYAGRAVLLAGPRINLWRAATDNDGIKAWTGQGDKPLGRWRAMGLPDCQWTVRSVDGPRLSDGVVTITIETGIAGRDAEGHAHPLAVHRQELRLGPDRRLVCKHEVELEAGVTDLPRIGVSLIVAPGLEQLTWLGRGPHENYCDRKASAFIGLHQDTVSGRYVPYIVPQEHGHCCDVRWLRLSDGQVGLLVQADGSMEFNASHHTDADLYAATHTNELAPRPEVYLNLDDLHRGLGTKSCGPDTLPKYLITGRTFRFRHMLSVVGGAEIREVRRHGEIPV